MQVKGHYIPGEVGKSEWDTIAAGPPYAVDAWGTGCLIHEVYANQPLAQIEDLRNTSCIPEGLLKVRQPSQASARRLLPFPPLPFPSLPLLPFPSSFPPFLPFPFHPFLRLRNNGSRPGQGRGGELVAWGFGVWVCGLHGSTGGVGGNCRREGGAGR